jgi:hypothetical protein
VLTSCVQALPENSGETAAIAGSPTRSVVLFIWFLAHHGIDSVWLLELANLTDLGGRRSYYRRG